MELSLELGEDIIIDMVQVRFIVRFLKLLLYALLQIAKIFGVE